MAWHRRIAWLLVALSGAAGAGWNSEPETIEQHPTWIYTPSTALPNGRHPLLIVLHGCAQTHTELKEFGNLMPAAEAHGMVVAVPSVGNRYFGTAEQRCWEYDGANDRKRNAADLVRLANRLKTRAALQIEPNHIYIAGLSSGAAMALQVACTAPDVFAGVGAVAGPSVGSSQFMALTEAAAIPASNVSNAVARCRALAGSKASHLATQVANVAYGDMDRNGAKALYPYMPGDTAHPGQYAVVSVRWTQDNIQALRTLYGTGALEASQPVQSGLGTLQVARRDGKPKASLLVVHDVGHAWPAGSGRPNNMSDGGRWIAQSGLNYTEFVAGWLISHNARAVPVGAPEVTLNASVSGTSVRAAGTARDADGTIARVDTVLLKASSAGAFLQADAHNNVTLAGDGSFNDRYDGLADGRYKLRITVTDNAGLASTVTSSELVVGNPAPLAECREFTDSNYSHVMRGRAQMCSFAFACAKGTGDNLGLFSVGITSTLSETTSQPGVFHKGVCAVP